MNHTSLVVLVILAALAAGIYATSTQAALADSVSFKQENKQKAKCLALVISRADACNQDARNKFNVDGPEDAAITPTTPTTNPTTTTTTTIPRG
ncbi:MAG: hypothetical protein ACJ72V_15135 [Nitrososphaeraceae archaeon]